MNSLALISPAGRLGRGGFVAAVVAVYILSFLSQALLAGGITARVGLWAFALAQAALIWAWIVLHLRRLRDAGQAAGAAVGIAVVYAMSIVLLLLIMSMLTATASSPQPLQDGQGLLQLLAVLVFFAALFGSAELGVLGYLFMALGLLMLAPLMISLGFTVVAALQPSVPAAP